MNTVAELPTVLEKAKVQPDARFITSNTDGTLQTWSCLPNGSDMIARVVYSFKRWDPVSGDDFFYLYNDGVNATTINVQLENEKKQRPYVLDTWSGDVIPIATYKQSQGR